MKLVACTILLMGQIRDIEELVVKYNFIPIHRDWICPNFLISAHFFARVQFRISEPHRMERSGGGEYNNSSSKSQLGDELLAHIVLEKGGIEEANHKLWQVAAKHLEMVRSDEISAREQNDEFGMAWVAPRMTGRSSNHPDDPSSASRFPSLNQPSRDHSIK